MNQLMSTYPSVVRLECSDAFFSFHPSTEKQDKMLIVTFEPNSAMNSCRFLMCFTLKYTLLFLVDGICSLCASAALYEIWFIFPSTFALSNSSCVYGLDLLSQKGIFSMCGEWWSWEVITIIVGLLGPTQLAVHVIYAQIIPLYYKIPAGLGMASSARVGALVGENQHHMAGRLGNAVLWFTLFETLSLGAISYVLRGYIPLLFTSDEEVIDLAVKLSPIFCFFVVSHGMQGSFQGILRGIKRQGKSAYAVIIGSWLISIPLACLLTFHPALRWRIFGVWAGNNVGYYVMDFIFLYLWATFKWNRGKEGAVGLLAGDGIISERLELDATHVSG